MLGWGIQVFNVNPVQKLELKGKDAFAPYLLATWEAGLDGLDWIYELKANGKAVQLQNDGFPNRYAAKAADVLPFIRHRLPSYSTQWVDGEDGIEYLSVKRHPDNIEGCPLDATVTIDAWDLG